MLDVYYCIQDQHDWRLVLLAGLICIAASMATVVLLRQARGTTGIEFRVWVATAGTASGFGIWATHFIAMLGYDPGVVAGYALDDTLASLAVAVAATMAGFWLALRSHRKSRRLIAGTVVGLGIAAMHYLGMQAVELPGIFVWSWPYVLASMLFAVLPIAPALSLALDRTGPRSAVFAGLLVVAAILLLHFTGMAAITFLPSRVEASSAYLLSASGMVVSVASAAFGVLLLGTGAALISSRARTAIEASEREFRILVEQISDCAIYMLDPRGRVITWNRGAERLKGYTREEALGLDLEVFFAADGQSPAFVRTALEAARRDGKFTSEGWRYRKDGTCFWAHATIEAVHDDRGLLHGFAKITRDMTRFKEDQDRLAELTTNLDAALSHMHQGLCLFDAEERLVLANGRALEILGLSEKACPAGLAFAELIRAGLDKKAGEPVSEGDLAEALARHRACIAQAGGGTLVVPFVDNCILSIAHQPMEGGGWVSTLDDITERRLAEERIEHMALHDGLTGLPNRYHHSERLAQALETARGSGVRVGVIGIDLDRFKEINDLHGHATGDRVLRLLAKRLLEVTQEGEYVARFGGDEFAAFRSFERREEFDRFRARLAEAFDAPLTLDGLKVSAGASLGIAIFPEDGTTLEQIVNNADLAMYRAKETVGQRVCYYEKGMDEVARARRLMANDLREAIARGELSLAFQVQKSVTTERITGYEALCRWQHPRDGWISPEEFIPVAEECGEILPLGEWVLRNACTQAASWPEPWRVAVNLSPIQLMHVDLVETVTSALVDAGLPASRLELEITESAFIADKLRALHVLRQIKALGVQVAIDDFGTGYSSLDTLNSFPFDKVKIDKSFLLESENSTQARAIIRAVLALGHSLNVPVLAEGLENEEQLRLLRLEGCDEAQGYLWGRPMSQPVNLTLVDATAQAG